MWMKYGNFFTNVAGKSPANWTLKWNYHGKLWDNDGKNTVYKWWVVAAGKYGWTCEFAYESSDDEIEVNRIMTICAYALSIFQPLHASNNKRI